MRRGASTQRRNNETPRGVRLTDMQPLRSLSKTGHTDRESLYILNNITHWRGPVAKEARATFKEFAK